MNSKGVPTVSKMRRSRSATTTRASAAPYQLVNTSGQNEIVNTSSGSSVPQVPMQALMDTSPIPAGPATAVVPYNSQSGIVGTNVVNSDSSVPGNHPGPSANFQQNNV